MSTVLDLLAEVLIRNGLVTAFAFVGITVWVSYLISGKLTRGRIHGSAIAILLGLIHQSDHLLLELGMNGSEGGFVVDVSKVVPRWCRSVLTDRAQRSDSTLDLHSELGEELSGDGARRHSRRCFSCRGTFQDVA